MPGIGEQGGVVQAGGGAGVEPANVCWNGSPLRAGESRAIGTTGDLRDGALEAEVALRSMRGKGAGKDTDGEQDGAYERLLHGIPFWDMETLLIGGNPGLITCWRQEK